MKKTMREYPRFSFLYSFIKPISFSWKIYFAKKMIPALKKNTNANLMNLYNPNKKLFL
jgi:hypothetical protein